MWIAVCVLALMTIVLFWPGQLIGNTTFQLDQARSGTLTDWHPPLMAYLWMWVGGSTANLLVLNTLLYWFGIGVIADTMWRVRGPLWAVAVVLVGLTPIALFNLGRVQRDNFMVSLLLVAAGLGQKVGLRGALAPGLLATMFRTDAIFAVPPLLVRSRRWPVRLALCLLLAVALVPITGFVNRTVLQAKPAHAQKSLQLFDIAGIQAWTGEIGPVADLRECYTPFWWDSLHDDCDALRRNPQSLTRPWLEAIAAHPIAYAAHRLAHFNQATFFLVDPLEDCRQDPAKARCAAPGPSLWRDAVTRNFLLWPITWLVVGGFLLFSRPNPFAQTLLWSAMLFGLVHLIVGVATEYRYFLWPELAIQLALVSHLSERGSLPRKAMLLALLATWGLGYTYRYLPLIV